METEIFQSFDEFENLWNELEGLKREDKSNDELSNKDFQVKCINPDCCSIEFDHSSNEFICKQCSTVQVKFLDTNAEWRYYGAEDNKSTNPTRCGMPTNDLLPKSSIGSIIGVENTREKYFQYSRMRNYHMWNSMPYKERSLFNILSNLNIQAGNNGLSQTIIDDAKILYKQLSEEKISRGDNRNGLIASSIYMSCKSNNVPRSAKEIAKMFNLNISTMTKACKKFNETMNIHYESSTAEDFIKRYCTKLNKGELIDDCIEVIRNANKYAIVAENAPPSVATGVIFMVSNHRKMTVPKKEIAKACEISEVTINKCYKKLCKFAKYILPADQGEMV